MTTKAAKNTGITADNALEVTSPEVPESPAAPPVPEGMAALYAALEGALETAATALGLSLGMEGKTFAPPVGTHLRAKVSITGSAAAALGPDAPTRVDGALEITACTQAGLGMSTAMAVATSVGQLFPRGLGLQLPDGSITFCTSKTAPLDPQGDRNRALHSIPFYAFIKA